MTILGVKGACYSHSNKLPETTQLATLENKSSDFVIDLDIQSHEEVA